MNQQIKTELHGILQRNMGNRLTEDLIMGISVRLLTLYERAVFECSQTIQEDAQTIQALNERIEELESATDHDGGGVTEPAGDGVPIGVAADA